MMKVLLINPSINFSKFGKFKNLLEPMPCIGIAYIAAMLEKHEHEVKIIDDFAFRTGIAGIMAIIADWRPDVVGLSCLTPSATRCEALSAAIRKHNPSIKIVWGNIHASYFARDILASGHADAIVHGEGEYTMSELIGAYGHGTPPEQVRGISLKVGNEIVRTDDRPLLMDLDELPYPAWHLFPVDRYGLLPFADIEKPILTMLSSRGCPFNCSFCGITYKKEGYRKRAVSKVVDEFEYLLDRFRVRQIGFVDAIFPLSKQHCRDFCHEMIKRGVNKKVIWTTETRVDIVDDEIAALLKEAGCRRLIFGIESGVEQLLKNVNKNYTLDDVRAGVESAHRAGLETIGLFMLGLPGETEELGIRTIEFAKGLPLDFAKFAILIPYPGTEIYDRLLKGGSWDRRDWDNFSTFNPNPEDLVYFPGQMTAKQLLTIQKKANREFYVRPSMIYRHLFEIRTIRPTDIFKGIYNLFS
ncbi:MAG: B12-binding domain-containing radical SAM protein [Deltaproteobacteria bacterium]|nr:B12-binding domain-containing radical SAM protein [Deltaproteobacteria bacterium]MCL5277548.1 B12-binding domain-containing radical SAM protein [Deltaproteobacteria bacterium]